MRYKPMIPKSLLFICIFCFLGISAQEAEIDTTEPDSLSSALPTIKVQVVDTLTASNLDGELPTSIVSTQVRDTLLYVLEDIEKARKIDSLWLQQLYKNDLFEEIYGVVVDQDFEPVDYEELPTEVLKQRLKELDAKTPFRVEYNPSLESVIKGYLKNRRRTMARLMALSDYYFPMFEEAFARQGLPLEMKYLAIVESALNPQATSRVGAQGLWQFMFQTGKLYGLGVSSYVDERNDPILATEAAAKYLKHLHENLEDWDLALAAYNSGPGNVSKAIRRSGGKTNYWNIRRYLPRETAGYVPAFLATMYIFEYAEEHGFKSNGPKFPYIATDTVKVKNMISLEQVAKVTNLPLEEVQFLNPSYKLGIIPKIKDKDYYVRLPINAVGKFLSYEEEIYALASKEFEAREKPLPELVTQNDRIRYKVRSGDYLGKIANRYGVSVSQIKRWNGLRSTNLRIGQRLTIYPRRMVKSASVATKKTDKPASAVVYTVKKGDTLWSISRKFPDVSIEDLKKWNDISSTKLKPGMKLRVSKS